jgi:general stress protein 26
MIDINSELDQKAKLLLNSEYVIWLTTVGKGGTPQPRPVWFIPYNDGSREWRYISTRTHAATRP